MSATLTNEIGTGTDSETRSGSRPSTKAPFRRWVRWTVFTDFLAMGWAALAALLVRFGWTEVDHGQISYYTVGVIVALAWPAILGVSGAYELRASLFGVEELRRVLRGAMVLLAVAGVVHIVFRLNLSRGYFLVLLPLAVLLTAGGRWLVKTAVNRDATGLNTHRVVAVGPGSDIIKFCSDLERTRTRSQVELVAYVADDLDPKEPEPKALRHLRRLPDRRAIHNLTDHDVTIDMLVRAGRPGPDEMWALGQRAHDLGVTVAIAPHRDDATHSVALSYVPLGSTPLLMVENPTLRPSAAVAKTVFDRVVAALLLVVLSPIFLVIMAAIAVSDGRPIFFRQTRVGRRGEPFACLKFRSMCRDAQDRLPELRDVNESDGPLFKIKNDPRITKNGRFLRKHSLDELPQLVNVLKGQMSVLAVGAPASAQEDPYEEPPPPADPEQPRTVANVDDSTVAPGQAVTVSTPPAFAGDVPVSINLARATEDGVALQLAVTRTEADGSVSYDITVPEDTPAGVYFLYITGEDDEGNPIVALVAIVVGSGEPAAASVQGDSADAPASFAAASTPVPAAVADVQSDLTPAAEAAVVEAVTQGGAGLVVSPEGTLQVRTPSGELQAAGALATTGSDDIAQQVTVGAALLLAGTGLVLLRRRGGFTK